MNSYILFIDICKKTPDVPELQRPNSYSQLDYTVELIKETAKVTEDLEVLVYNKKPEALPPPPLQDPKHLHKFIRMNGDTFDELLHIVGPSISKLSTNFKDSIAPEERLAVTLRFCLLMPRNTKAVTCYKRYKLGTKTFVTGCAKHVTNTSASSQRETVF